MFNTMINGDSSFAEKQERKVKVPYSSKAVEMMVKFMYGIELEDYKDLYKNSDVTDQNLHVFLELIEIGGVYGIENLDKGAAEKIKRHVTKENVFHVLSFAHLHKTDDLKKICTDKIISKHSEKAVLDQKVLIDCPELGVELWKLFEDKKKNRRPKKCRTSSEDSTESSYHDNEFS